MYTKVSFLTIISMVLVVLNWLLGVFYASNGNSYMGSFSNSLYDGFGTFKWIQDGLTYEGRWKEGKFHGKGSLNYANGDKFVGHFCDGQKQGKGAIVKASGDV